MGNSQVKLKLPNLERVMGIEPTSSAWKAEVLPLNYTRLAITSPNSLRGSIQIFASRLERPALGRNSGLLFGVQKS